MPTNTGISADSSSNPLIVPASGPPPASGWDGTPHWIGVGFPVDPTLGSRRSPICGSMINMGPTGRSVRVNRRSLQSPTAGLCSEPPPLAMYSLCPEPDDSGCPPLRIAVGQRTNVTGYGRTSRKISGNVTRARISHSVFSQLMPPEPALKMVQGC